VNATSYRSVEEASEAFSTAYAPIVVTPPDGSELDIELEASRLGKLLLFRSFTGSGVHFSTVSPFDGYTISIPISGHMRVGLGRADAFVEPARGFVIDAKKVSSLAVGPSTEYTGFSLPRGSVESTYESFTQRPAIGAITFESEVSTELTSTFRSLFGIVFDSLKSGILARNPLALASFEDAILRLLLFSQPHNFSLITNGPARVGLPRDVRRAMSFIDENCRQAISSADVAGDAGVSLRSLQASFATYAGISLYGYLRARRLHGARLDLLSGKAVSVTDAAHSWGFVSLGQFSKLYFRTYGEHPRDTLRRG